MTFRQYPTKGSEIQPSCGTRHGDREAGKMGSGGNERSVHWHSVRGDTEDMEDCRRKESVPEKLRTLSFLNPLHNRGREDLIAEEECVSLLSSAAVTVKPTSPVFQFSGAAGQQQRLDPSEQRHQRHRFGPLFINIK